MKAENKKARVAGIASALFWIGLLGGVWVLVPVFLDGPAAHPYALQQAAALWLFPLYVWLFDAHGRPRRNKRWALLGLVPIAMTIAPYLIGIQP